MGDDHEGGSEVLLDVGQLELRLLAKLLVESAERLVQEQHLRPLGERAGKSDALALAAGELVWLALGELLKLDELQHLLDAVADLGLRHAVLLEAEGYVGLHRHMREQCVGLEHHVHRPPVGRHARDILTVEQDAPRARHLEAGKHAKKRSLAAAGGAQQREELALEDIEGHVVDGDEVAKALRHVLKADERNRAGVIPRRELAPDRPDGLGRHGHPPRTLARARHRAGPDASH